MKGIYCGFLLVALSVGTVSNAVAEPQPPPTPGRIVLSCDATYQKALFKEALGRKIKYEIKNAIYTNPNARLSALKVKVGLVGVAQASNVEVLWPNYSSLNGNLGSGGFNGDVAPTLSFTSDGTVSGPDDSGCVNRYRVSIQATMPVYDSTVGHSTTRRAIVGTEEHPVYVNIQGNRRLN